jgi:hypothetical protein
MKKYLIGLILLISSVIGYSQTYLGETSILPGTSDATTRYAYPFVAPATGTLDEVYFYYNITGLSSRKVLVAVYDNSYTFTPSSRLGITDTIVLATNTSGWKSASLLSPTTTITTNDTIWLAIVSDKALFLATSTVNGSVGINRRTVTTNNTFAYGLPNPFGTSSSTPGTASIYAHYSITGASYTPVTGRDVWAKYRGANQITSAKGSLLYFKKKSPPPSTDSVKMYIQEDFESWTNATVQSKDSLERRFPMSWMNYSSAQNSIVNVGGEHGNVWNWLMYAGGNFCNEFHIHLNDTAKEAIYEFDLWVQGDFNPDGPVESATKFPGGFYMSNSFASTGTDTVTVNGLGGWPHNVGGTGVNSMRLYSYHQATSVWPESTRSFYSSGTWSMPLGYWQHNYIRVFVGDPGKENAFIERAVDGVVVAVVNNLKYRSATQGEDFGNIEAIRNSFQFGGSGPDYASQQNQSIRIDNMIAYKYKPGSHNYRHPARSIGDVVPSVALTQSELSPPDILVDETYTNASDTIYDVGNGKHYLYQPYNKRDIFTKTIELSSGTINFTFLTEEFGYYESSPINSNYWIKVYKWTGGVKDALPTWTFGRSEVGFTNPSGTYVTGTDKISLDYNIGYNGYETRGTVIRYFTQL